MLTRARVADDLTVSRLARVLLVVAVIVGGLVGASFGEARAAVASPVVALAAGADHTCVLTSDGLVYCWGDNSGGQLGDGSTTARAVPVQVVGLSGAHKSPPGTGMGAADIPAR